MAEQADPPDQGAGGALLGRPMAEAVLLPPQPEACHLRRRCLPVHRGHVFEVAGVGVRHGPGGVVSRTL